MQKNISLRKLLFVHATWLTQIKYFKKFLIWIQCNSNLLDSKDKPLSFWNVFPMSNKFHTHVSWSWGRFGVHHPTVCYASVLLCWLLWDNDSRNDQASSTMRALSRPRNTDVRLNTLRIKIGTNQRALGELSHCWTEPRLHCEMKVIGVFLLNNVCPEQDGLCSVSITLIYFCVHAIGSFSVYKV